ncbi:Uncharacterised protein [Mycobacteroides abscessus subsp. abscessus]|nr:Uncharacterised protein [Mycobacteroides abscessus subsp. abscessus]
MLTVMPTTAASASAIHGCGHVRSATNAGIATILPTRMVAIMPRRSLMRPPSSVPITPPPRNIASPTPPTAAETSR